MPNDEKNIRKNWRAGSSAPIGAEEVLSASAVLDEYMNAKKKFDEQIRKNEEWWRLNHWSVMRAEKKDAKERPTSAWTFNSVVNKHADLIDNIPTSVVLPREQSDESEAKTLTSILPVINERCGFESVYSSNGWYKLKNGLAVYAVTWDNDAAGGLGDVSVSKVDVLNIFWEPNITDIQDSANVFVLAERDARSVENEYGLDEGTLSSDDHGLTKYAVSESNGSKGKCVVVDWYYKRDGVLHLAKFSGETLLFASENEKGYENEKVYENGFYEHGMYPFVFDSMYPLEGTLFSFGVIEVCRDPQGYIDTLDGLVLENLKKMAKPRYFGKKNCGINKTDFENEDVGIVDVEGDVNDNRLMKIEVPDISVVVGEWKRQKIDELKETSSNRDVSQGGTSGGVTSGAAIATLQEAGNKTSRDFISATFRAYREIVKLEIELVRQFYTDKRVFRIVGEDGMTTEYIEYSNANIKPDLKGKEPIFDLQIKAQKKSPYSQTALNETAMNLYSAGFFNPDNAQAAMTALEMMDFDGIQQVKERVKGGMTLKKQLDEMQAQLVKLAETVQLLTGGQAGQAGQAMTPQPSFASKNPTTLPREGLSDLNGGAGRFGDASVAAENAEKLKKNAYTETLMKRARPDMEG